MTDVQETLIKLAKEGDAAAKERLVEKNVGLVWSVVRRYLGRGVDSDDLFQLGCLGFLKAIDGFDVSFGTQFSTYAVPKISGEIRRFLRDDGTVKVSRSVKEKAAMIKNARHKLMAQWNREPSLSELSDTLGMTVEEIAAAELATASTESIYRETGEDGFTLEDILTEGAMEDDLIESISLKEAIGKLVEREQQVIVLRYFHGLTQDQTAKIMGVSQVQISRIEKKAIQNLRKILCNDKLKEML